MTTASLPAQLARTRRFTRGAPGCFTITADGAAVLYLRGRSGDDPRACLWRLDLDSGTEEVLAGPGIDAYATDAAARMAAYPLDGGLWTVDADGTARRLPARGPVAGPRPDPEGRRIAYVSGGALRVICADGTGDREIAAPEHPAAAFGPPPHVDGERGHWWSPDGTRLLAARTDVSRVALWHLANPAEPASPPRTIRYAAAGTPNADVTLWLIDLDGTRTEARWDRAAFEYLAGAGWDAHGPYAVVQSRDQRTVRFLAVDPATGATTCRAEQRDPCWVQLVPGLPARTASGALVAHADRDGTRHLTMDGVPVTPPGLQLRAVLSVDGTPVAPPGPQSRGVLGVDGDTVLFTASEDPTETHLWTYRPGSGARRLSTEPGTHTGVRRAGTLVHAAPRGRFTAVRDGRPPVTVPTRAEPPVLDVHARHLVLGPDRLRAVLYLPSWHRPGSARLPVLLDPYGGAARQRATIEQDWASLVAQWFAEQGYAVLAADGRGTPGRGPDWERAVHGDLLGPVLDDQVTALHEAVRLEPDLDPSRVGIRGWSFAGTLAAWAVLRRPDVFHAAVAGAGVTDQRRYEAHWRERFLGHPGAPPGPLRRRIPPGPGPEPDPPAPPHPRPAGRERAPVPHPPPVLSPPRRRPPARGPAPAGRGPPRHRRPVHRGPAPCPGPFPPAPPVPGHAVRHVRAPRTPVPRPGTRPPPGRPAPGRRPSRPARSPRGRGPPARSSGRRAGRTPGRSGPA